MFKLLGARSSDVEECQEGDPLALSSAVQHSCLTLLCHQAVQPVATRPWHVRFLTRQFFCIGVKSVQDLQVHSRYNDMLPATRRCGNDDLWYSENSEIKVKIKSAAYKMPTAQRWCQFDVFSLSDNEKNRALDAAYSNPNRCEEKASCCCPDSCEEKASCCPDSCEEKASCCRIASAQERRGGHHQERQGGHHKSDKEDTIKSDKEDTIKSDQSDIGQESEDRPAHKACRSRWIVLVLSIVCR